LTIKLTRGICVIGRWWFVIGEHLLPQNNCVARIPWASYSRSTEAGHGVSRFRGFKDLPCFLAFTLKH